MSRPRPRVLVAFVAVMALSACGGASGGGGAVGGEGPTEVGGDLQLDRSSAATTAPGTPPPASTGTTTTTRPLASGEGRVTVLVRDPRGPGRSGVPVVVEGPTAGAVASGPGGRTDVVGRPGRYRLSIPSGCTDELEIVRGGSAEVGLAAGQTAAGELTVDARLRLAPSGPGGYHREDGEVRADWRVGQVHVVDLTLADRCGEGPAALGTSLGRARFAPGPGLEIVGQPPRVVGESGRISIRLRCTGPEEDVALDLVDPELSMDGAPVFTRAVMAEQSTPFCTAS